MKTARNILMLIITALSVTACVEPIVFDTRNAEPMLVVYGEIDSSQKRQKVIISRSSTSLNDTSPTYMDDAVVEMRTSEGNRIEFEYTGSEKGAYESKWTFSAKPGVEYTLYVSADIDNDGIPEDYVIPADQVPATVYFEKIDTQLVYVAMLGVEGYKIVLWGDEPRGPNYYMYKIYINGRHVTNNIINYYTMSDEHLDGTRLEEVTLSTHPSRNMINQLVENGAISPERAEELEKLGILEDGDQIEVFMCSVSKGYYNFVNQAQSERGGSNPMFGGPPANIQGNIPGGLGYFAVYCYDTLSTIVGTPEELGYSPEPNP